MADPKFHPNLMQMYKTVGFNYANSLDVFKVEGGQAPGASAAGGADAYDYTADADFEDNSTFADSAPVGLERPPDEKELLQILDEIDPLPEGKQRTKLNIKQIEMLKNAEHIAGYENLITVFEHCSPEEIELYRDWYYKANADCKELAGKLGPQIQQLGIQTDPVRVIISVVAATSQGTLWEENLRLAGEIIRNRGLPKNVIIVDSEEIEALSKERSAVNKQLKITPDDENLKKRKAELTKRIKQLKSVEGDEESAGGGIKITKTNLALVQQILKGGTDVLQSNKFKTFELSILDPKKYENSVVVDTHAACIWIGQRLGVQDPEYTQYRPSGARLARMTRDYRKAAGAVGHTPQAFQAITWSVWRTLPVKFKTEYMHHLDTEPASNPQSGKLSPRAQHPEVEMFKALYPYIFSTVNPGAKKKVWRWKYDKFGKPSMKDKPDGVSNEEWKLAVDMANEYSPRPHPSAREFVEILHRFGPNMWKYYGFPEDAWKAFLRDHPKWGNALLVHQQAHTASILETAAERIILPYLR